MSRPQNHQEPDNPIDEPMAELVRWKARGLVGCAGLTRDDCPDVEQELVMRLLAPLKKFSRARGRRLSYARMLIDRFAINLLRDRSAAKRNSGPLAPLPASLPGKVTEADVVRALDVAAAMERLPEALREVAELRATRTVTEVAQALGVSRSTVYSRLRELRGRTEVQALRENLPTSPDTPGANRE